jgi:hypothetical protein
VANQLQRLGIAVGEDCDLGAVGERRRQIAQLAVYADRQGRLGKARPDRPGRVGAAGAVGQLQGFSVGQGDVDFGRCLDAAMLPAARVRATQRGEPARAWRTAINGQLLFPRTGPFTCQSS